MIDPTLPLPEIEAEKQEKNRVNQTSWKPGQSGNPKGRPKKDWTWKDLYKEIAEEMTDVKKKDGTTYRAKYKHLVAKKIFIEAINGNIGAIKELANRMDGMPKQTNELSGNVEIVTRREP